MTAPDAKVVAPPQDPCAFCRGARVAESLGGDDAESESKC